MKTNKKKKIVYILFFMYASLMIWEVFIGPYRSHSSIRRYNLIPFRTIVEYISKGSLISSKTVFINLIANIVVFIPLGFFLVILFKQMKGFICSMINYLLIIIFIEAMQFALNVGVFDIDDIILNTLGCIIGYSIYVVLTKNKYINFGK